MSIKSNKEILSKIYSSQSFAKNGHALVDLLEQYLTSNLNDPEKKTISFVSPSDMLDYWQKYNNSEAIDLYQDFLSKSIHVHNPKYIGHQVVPPAPDTALVSLLGAMINNGGAVYEMGMASNALEKVVIDKLKPYFGYEAEGGGIMTSGGTLANLTALLCARSQKGNDVWQFGTNEKYAFMVSAEAHYCIDRAVKIMGWGDEGVIKVPVDSEFRIRIDLLEKYKSKAEGEGINVIGIVGSAPTTSTGNYDDLLAIGDFAQKHNMWYHIDGAHGGPAVFSPKYKHLMDGSNKADSITVDGHKMMMLPALTTILFFKNDKLSYKTFIQEAQYLWENDHHDWSNPGKRTFECTKLIMSLRYFILQQLFGVEGFAAFLEECYDKGKVLASLVLKHNEFELATQPDSNIVCFRPKKCTTVNQITAIRKSLLKDGRYYIVQTTLNKDPYLRVSIMNPFTSQKDFVALLNLITKIADEIKS